MARHPAIVVTTMVIATMATDAVMAVGTTAVTTATNTAINQGLALFMPLSAPVFAGAFLLSAWNLLSPAIAEYCRIDTIIALICS